jgi:hypothetical protein
MKSERADDEKYCDAQCARDLKFVGGKGNIEGWRASSNDANAGVGPLGGCCAEIDIWYVAPRAPLSGQLLTLAQGVQRPCFCIHPARLQGQQVPRLRDLGLRRHLLG